MKKRLLFVDDDTNILDGLRCALQNQVPELDVHFVSSASQALALMATLPIDFIIADIRMPDMDGSQLLNHVKIDYPNTIRMILSGHSDSNLILSSVSVAHQYVPKPCDPELLKSVIAQADESKVFLRNEHLKSLVSQLGKALSVPVLFRKITKELNSPEPSARKVGEIIAKDPRMTARILQLANSGFFGLRCNMSKITDAVSYLGIFRTAQLLLAVHAFSELRPTENGSSFAENLWIHSHSIAARAKRIAEEQQASWQTADDAFTAGLLHDVGKLVLASHLPEQYKETVLKATTDHIPLWQAECESFSTTHAEVGGYLLSVWGLPKPIVEAAAFHHNPAVTSAQSFTPLAAVHAADVFEYLSNGEPNN
jgi:HD-like signal output (HDOD) protein/ActR/RegA family two-component response regulator